MYISPFHSNGFCSAKFLLPGLIEFCNDFLCFLACPKTAAQSLNISNMMFYFDLFVYNFTKKTKTKNKSGLCSQSWMYYLPNYLPANKSTTNERQRLTARCSLTETFYGGVTKFTRHSTIFSYVC